MPAKRRPNDPPKLLRVPDSPRTVEEPRATDPQFPAVIENPDMEVTAHPPLSGHPRPSHMTVELDGPPLHRILVWVQMRDSGPILLDMSPTTAAELGAQLLYARDKLTGRR